MRRRRASVAQCAGAILLAACDPGGPTEPEPSSIGIVIIDHRQMPQPAALRYAVVWSQGGGDLVVTDDGPLDGDGTLATLALPHSSVLARVTPQELVVLSATHQAELEPAYRPRFVIYEDLDQSGDFAPALPDAAGPDHVWGIDGDDGGVAALFDTEAALEALPMEALDRYYAATGGHFSAFVAVSFDLPLDVRPWSPTLEVELDDTDYAALSLGCGRPLFSPQASELTVTLGPGVDPAYCGLFAASCDIAPLSELEPPEISPLSGPGQQRLARCFEHTGLQTLVIAEGHAWCDACACRRDFGYSVFATVAEERPEWWPCGGELPFCAGNDLFSPEAECTPP